MVGDRPGGRRVAGAARDAPEHRRCPGRALRRRIMTIHASSAISACCCCLLPCLDRRCRGWRAGVLLALWLVLTRRGRQTLSVTTRRHQHAAPAPGRVVGDRDRHRRRGRRAGGDAGDGRRLYRETLQQTGSDDTAIVLRGGSPAELNSVLDRDSVTVIAQAPGIARDAQGTADGVGRNRRWSANLPLKGDPSGRRCQRADPRRRRAGVGAAAQREDRRGPQLQARPARADRGQGRAAAVRRAGGRQEIRLGGQAWTVVGVFASGDAHGLGTVGRHADWWPSAYRRGSSVQSVTVRLTSTRRRSTRSRPRSSADPRLKVDVDTTREYFSQAVRRPDQGDHASSASRSAAIMAIGAIFGALNTHVRGGRGACAGNRHLARDRLPRHAGGGVGHAGDDAAGPARRPARRPASPG